MYNKIFNKIFMSILALTLSVLTSCGTKQSQQNTAINYLLPNGSVLSIPSNQLHVGVGSITSTSIAMIGGSANYQVQLSTQLSNNHIQKNSTNSPFEAVITPNLLISGSSNTIASLQLNALNSALPGKYTLSIYAKYIKDAKYVTNVIGTINITITEDSVNPQPGQLTFLPSSVNVIKKSNNQVYLSLNDSSNVNMLNINISSQDTSIASISSSTCILSTESNNCTIDIFGLKQGATTIKITVAGYPATYLSVIVIAPNDIYIGNLQGLVYKNESVIAGESSISQLDYFGASQVLIDTNNTLYAMSQAYIWKFNQLSNTWQNIFTSSAGANLKMALDSQNNLYLASSKGSLYKILNNSNQAIFLTNSDIITNEYPLLSDIAIDSNGNIYAIFSNILEDETVVSIVAKFNQTTSSWQSLNNPNDDQIELTHIIIDNDNNIYVGSLYGMVYKYSSSNLSWSSLGDNKPGGQQISSMGINNGLLYVGNSSGDIYDITLANSINWNLVGNYLLNQYISSLSFYNDNIIATTINNDEISTIYQLNNSNNTWEQVNQTNGSYLMSSTFDSVGNLYLGSTAANNNLSNVFKVPATNQAELSVVGGNSVSGSNITTIVKTSESNMLIGTSIGELFAYSNTLGKWQLLNILNQGSNIVSIQNAGSLNYAYTINSNYSNSLFQINNNNQVVELALPNQLAFIDSMATSSNGTLFISKFNELWSYNQSNGWVNLNLPQKYKRIDTMFFNNKDDTLYLAINNTIVALHNNNYQQIGSSIPYDAQTISYGPSISNINVDNFGNIYIAAQYLVQPELGMIDLQIWKLEKNSSQWIDVSNNLYGLFILTNAILQIDENNNVYLNLYDNIYVLPSNDTWWNIVPNIGNGSVINTFTL